MKSILFVLCIGGILIGAPPELELEKEVRLEGFHSKNREACIVNIGEGDRIFVLDTEASVLWRFGPKGKLERKVDLEQLPIDPQVPLEQRVRATGMWSLVNGSVLIAEGNTATLYKLNAEGTIDGTISMENSPRGLIALASDTLVVFYQDFSGKHVGLLNASGQVLDTILVSQSGVGKSPSGISFSTAKPTYFHLSDHEFFFVPTTQNHAYRCVAKKSNLSCEKNPLM